MCKSAHYWHRVPFGLPFFPPCTLSYEDWWTPLPLGYLTLTLVAVTYLVLGWFSRGFLVQGPNTGAILFKCFIWVLHDHWVLTQELETVEQVDAIFRGSVHTFWFLWGSVARSCRGHWRFHKFLKWNRVFKPPVTLLWYLWTLLCSKEKKALSNL